MHFSEHIFPVAVLVTAALGGAASADESTSRALFFMAQAQHAAQSQVGYAALPQSDDDACCASGAMNSLARYGQIGDQIARLSAAMQSPKKPIVLSPADLARGAY